MNLDPPRIGSAFAHGAPRHDRSEVDLSGAPIRDCAQVSKSAGAYIGVRPAFLKIGPPPTTASLASQRGEQGRPQVSRTC